ncbi:MAG: hypothetical protein IKK56_05915, partial [Methanocorpusculum sp.]|nr:hypothetical protein [Methanocorpusculum sp.]
MSGNRKTIHQFVLAVVTALVLCAVCVGGVSGATYYVGSAEPDSLSEGEYYYPTLEAAVSAADSTPEDDTIIIMNSITLHEVGPMQITNGKLTIVNAPGVDVVVTKDAPSRTILGVSYYDSFFEVTGGALILSTEYPGSLRLDGESHILGGDGGAVYVNGGTLVMNEGVNITQFGWIGNLELFGFQISDYDGSGVYIENGTFIMNGGNITDCQGDQGGAVYVSANTTFVMNDGVITKNGHNEVTGIFGYDASTGGAVFVEDDGLLIQNGGD